MHAPCAKSVRMSLSSSIMCLPASASSITSGLTLAVAHASGSSGHRSRRCQASAGVPALASWHMCWSPSMPITCRFIASRQSAPAEASTMPVRLADWVRRSATLLDPLVDALERHMMEGSTLHADACRSLRRAPVARGPAGCGPFASATSADMTVLQPPPCYSAMRPIVRAERPAQYLTRFTDDPDADDYAGFDHSYGGRIAKVAFYAHVRYKFFDVHAASGFRNRARVARLHRRTLCGRRRNARSRGRRPLMPSTV